MFLHALKLDLFEISVRGGVWKLLSEEAARDALFKVLEKPQIARKQLAPSRSYVVFNVSMEQCRLLVHVVRRVSKVMMFCS